MSQQLGLISPAEASITRRTASVPLLRILNDAQPASYWPGGAAAPMHTALDFWQSAGGCAAAAGAWWGGGACFACAARRGRWLLVVRLRLTSATRRPVPPSPTPCSVGTGRLQFPCHLYFLGQSKVCKYGLASKATGAFVVLPATNREGRRHRARYVVHSAKQHAWLVFFESSEPPPAAPTGGRAAAAAAAAPGDAADAASDADGSDAGGGAGASAAAAEAADAGRWEFCLVKEGLSMSDQGAWFLPGAARRAGGGGEEATGPRLPLSAAGRHGTTPLASALTRSRTASQASTARSWGRRTPSSPSYPPPAPRCTFT
jgi:hypothetical protein